MSIYLNANLRLAAVVALVLLGACRGNDPACSDDTTACDGLCVVLSTDAKNCGACGMSCAADLVCVAGSCVAADAGLPSDAGMENDAGTNVDAGMTTDAGVTTDAGMNVDAGVTTDAGTIIDAGPPVDAGPGPESNCLDGLDNNQDGLTDCADPTCTPFVTCESADWSPPGSLVRAAIDAGAACPMGATTTTLGGTGALAQPATCGCRCTNPRGSGACAISIRTNEYTSSSCPPGVPTSGTSLSACAASAFVSGGYFFRPGLAESGTCTATGSTTLPPPQPAAQVTRHCAPPQPTTGGCSPGLVCRARVTTADAGTCIIRAGDVACPSPYVDREVFYGTAVDTRGCTACTCAYRSDGCDGTVRAYASSNCTGTPMVTGTASGLQSCLVGNPGSFSVTATGSINPSCLPVSPQPNGCFREASPTTACCAAPAGAPRCPTAPGPAMAVIRDATPFCMDTTEVTNTQYAAFLAAAPSLAQQPGECAANTSFVPSSGWPATTPDRPVVFVDWCDATAYCAWAGKRLCGRNVGSPALSEVEATSTESQWFLACSAGNTASVPYGAAASSAACPPDTVEDVTSRACCARPTPRVYGLVSNASEWLNACSGDAGLTDTCRIAGSFSSSLSCSTAVRSLARDTRSSTVGFRCCAPFQ